MVERKIHQLYLEPKIPQDQKPSPYGFEPWQKGGFDRQVRSPLEEARFEFLLEAMVKEVHANKPERMTRKVWNRWIDISERLILKGESAQDVAQIYGKSNLWVNRELRAAIGMFYSNSPEDLRRRILKETILPARAQMLKERYKNQDEENAARLGNPNLNKEQLKEIKPKIGERFYSRHKELFMRLPKLIKKSGLLPTTPADLAVAVLEQEGGVVVFSYHEKNQDQRRVKTRYLVLIHDVEDSVDTLKSAEGLEDYQGGYW